MVSRLARKRRWPRDRALRGGLAASGLDDLPVLIVPGLNNSGETHWQSCWQRAMPSAERVEQTDWSRPDLDAWMESLAQAVERRPGALLAAHSLGCVLVAHLAAQRRAWPIAGALLVAPPDVERAGPAGPLLRGFGPMPRSRLPFPATVVASRNDPYMSYPAAARLAQRWGATLVDLGRAGHVNVESGHGPWPEGLTLLGQLARRATAPVAAPPPLPRSRTAESETPMALALGDVAPNFKADTTEGPIDFHEWLGDAWAVLFSHPKDFTPVCTTELGAVARLKPEFDRRGVKVIGLSVDPVSDHDRWASDIAETQGHALNYPLIGDTDLSISKAWGLLPGSLDGAAAGRTAADNQTVRNVFVIGPDRRIKLILVYPMTTGRNFDEILRVIDSLQLTATHRVATPADWKQGEDVIIAGSVSNDEARKLYPDGWREPKPYIRIVPQPKT